MRLPSHLKLSRHGVWCFRLVLPDALAVVLGQKEIRRSLGTRCPEIAKFTAYLLSAKMMPIIKLTKTAMTFDPNSIDPDKIRELIVKGLEIDSKTGNLKADYIETSNDPKVAEQELAALANMVKERGWSPESQAYFEAERTLMMANTPMPRPKAGNPCTLEEGIKAFIEFKADLAQSSRDLYQYRLNLLSGLVGGPSKMLHEITKQACIQAAEKCRNMSPHASKRSSDKPGNEKVSATTVKATLALWQSFFEWAIGSDRYADVNPISKIPRPGSNNTQRGAVPFLSNELEKIFQPENFVAMKRPHQFWGPLFALFTGARSNEIAQLRLSDFITLSGVRCINIEHDPANGTQLKNAASNRVVPLHPILWSIGLQDYLNDLNGLGAMRLFPNLPIDGKGKREKYLSRDFNENLLGKLGIRKARVKVFHSFRDTLASKLAAGKVHPAYMGDWLGHAREGTESEHYIFPLTPTEQVETVLPVLNFELDFSGFKYEQGRWNGWLSKNMVP